MHSVDSNRQHGKAANNASTAAEKQRIIWEMGVTGETIFYRLYDLCGFNPVFDMVVDVMHALLLNLVRSELENHLLGDLGHNLSLNISDCSPAHGALLNRKDFSAALSAAKWTVEMKDGRVPTVTESKDKHKLGGWTAEDLSKFITVAPVVLRELIPKAAYASICCLNEMYSLIFSKHLRIQGWSSEYTHNAESTFMASQYSL